MNLSAFTFFTMLSLNCPEKFVKVSFHVLVVDSRDGAISVQAVETPVKPLGNFLTFKNHFVRSWLKIGANRYSSFSCAKVLVYPFECSLCDLSGQFMASASDHVMCGTNRATFRSNVG